MSNFLVIASSLGSRPDAAEWFGTGLEVARSIRDQLPDETIETDWARVATFPRQNGSATPITSDPATGSWLLACGTWFHQNGYGSGHESRLLKRYLEVGSYQLTQELEGFFSIAVGDARIRETVVLTDLAGSCHCFYRQGRDVVALAGSSLLLAGLADFRLDTDGCQEFLYTGIIYEDRTFYREVRKFAPAGIFRFRDGQLKSEERYWHISNLPVESLSGRPAVRAVGEALVDAARRIGSLFRRPVCDLTGGYDSRAVVAAFLSAGLRPSTTVSGPTGSPDVAISRLIANQAGLTHVHLERNEEALFELAGDALVLTDGECDLMEYARTLMVHRTLSERFGISLNGCFGELARGYWWELLFPRTSAPVKLDALQLARRRFAAENFDDSLYPPETRLDLASHFAAVVERTNAGLSRLPNTTQMDHAYLAMRMQRWQGRIASSTNQIWPCLSPFLFRSVLEPILQTKARFRTRSLLIRKLLAEYQPWLAELPLDAGYPALPFSWRNLHRYAPLLKHYGQRVKLKLGSKFSRGGSTLFSSTSLPIRLRLWARDDVQDLLNPSGMQLCRFTEATAISDFLRRSRKHQFPFDKQWSRVLSLEFALLALERARKTSNIEQSRGARRHSD